MRSCELSFAFVCGARLMPARAATTSFARADVLFVVGADLAIYGVEDAFAALAGGVGVGASDVGAGLILDAGVMTRGDLYF